MRGRRDARDDRVAALDLGHRCRAVRADGGHRIAPARQEDARAHAAGQRDVDRQAAARPLRERDTDGAARGRQEPRRARRGRAAA